ncbi:hypothetical protein [Malonomonas rubra]|uniref:hypothetical protein n=1 Tax=Malonomonas rubra TaxID=57040 RepID=UPI0026E95F27|nr:hypothetical protein [Malonomonas rubra]
MAENIKPVILKNGLVIRFVDQSNRYFGDYHRVFILVTIFLPDDFELPVGMKKDRACLEKSLEKMGVPSEAVETERQALIDAFLQTSRSYLEQENFLQHLLVKLEKERPKPVFLRGL